MDTGFISDLLLLSNTLEKEIFVLKGSKWETLGSSICDICMRSTSFWFANEAIKSKDRIVRSKLRSSVTFPQCSMCATRLWWKQGK
jgi:hypothetical protein